MHRLSLGESLGLAAGVVRFAAPRRADRLDRRRVLQRRHVARVEAEPGGPGDATHDLAAAGPGQVRDGDHGLRTNRLAEVVDDELGDLGADRRVPGRRPGAGTQNTTIASPLSSSGTPIAAASMTAGWATAADSTSAGPTRLPATLSVSSERPWMYQKPSASIGAQSPWTQRPGMRDQ